MLQILYHFFRKFTNGGAAPTPIGALRVAAFSVYSLGPRAVEVSGLAQAGSVQGLGPRAGQVG